MVTYYIHLPPAFMIQEELRYEYLGSLERFLAGYQGIVSRVLEVSPVALVEVQQPVGDLDKFKEDLLRACDFVIRVEQSPLVRLL